MAIVQVSRITNRKGLNENLPQLAGAELGWCIDTRQLFIGNGTLQEGAPVIGNTEILTEFSDIVGSSQYIYADPAAGYVVQTGATPSDPIVRTVQEKLDDFASVRDFGAMGDGVTDDTQAINRALYQLYCRESNTAVRRTLYFPAGTYVITESVVIPTFAKLVGEGADCTIIQLAESLDVSSLTAYVARFGDSLQQVGANMGNNGATLPKNIEISSMTFQTLTVTDVFLLQSGVQCYFDSVNFLGPFVSSDITDPGFLPFGADNIAGARFSSSPETVTQITFDKCRFSGTAFGISTNEEIHGITVSNSAFDTLWQGIVLGNGAVVGTGPTGFRAKSNIFDNIYAEGIVYDFVNLNVSAYNVFYNVGNSIGAGSPTYPVIRFGNDNNVSVSDLFERSDADANVYARIAITNNGTTLGATSLALGNYVRQNGRVTTLANNQTNTTIFSLNNDLVKAFRVDYQIVRGSKIGFGCMFVVSGPDDSISDVSTDEERTENIATGITLAVTQVGSTLSLVYSSTNTGQTGTFTYSIAQLA